MKILLTNHHLKRRAGSELFTFDLAKALKNKGHQVFVFSFHLGEVSKKIEKEGIPVTDDLIDFEEENFDIIHAQHNVTAILVRSFFPDTPMVFMAHGVLPELEQPPSIELGISKFIAVSDEVRKNLARNHGIEEEKVNIIHNFVDTSRFYCKKEIGEKLEKVLVISNHFSNDVKDVVEKSCLELGLELMHVGFPNNSVENIEDYINKADLVVSLGRGALEAMACERNVIVFDIHGGDGFVTPENFFEIRKNNFSGRRFGKKYDVEGFKKELLKYNKENAKRIKHLVLKEHSKDIIIKKIEEEYKKAKEEVNRIGSKIKKGELVTEILFLEKIFSCNDDRLGIIVQKDQFIEKLVSEIDEKRKIIQQKNQEIKLMKSSKFWKMREGYWNFREKIKNLIKL